MRILKWIGIFLAPLCASFTLLITLTGCETYAQQEARAADAAGLTPEQRAAFYAYMNGPGRAQLNAQLAAQQAQFAAEEDARAQERQAAFADQQRQRQADLDTWLAKQQAQAPLQTWQPPAASTVAKAPAPAPGRTTPPDPLTAPAVTPGLEGAPTPTAADCPVGESLAQCQEEIAEAVLESQERHAPH